MKTKDEVQKEIIKKIVIDDFRGIVLASVRSGKTRILLTAIQEHQIFLTHKFKDESIVQKSILVLYPNIDIKKSWLDECDIINYHPHIIFSTFASVAKIKTELYDYIIVDEAHLLGEENQLPAVAELVKNNKHVILASGTFNSETLNAIKTATKLQRIVNYSTEDAIKDGIVNNFNIIVHQYKLDNRIPMTYGKTKKWRNTELQECNRLSGNVSKTIGQQKMFHALARMRFINSTASLVAHVNDWITKHPKERFLLFTGDEKIGKRFKIPMFNSKSDTNMDLLAFLEGEINQLCLIKKGSAGITYPNLKTILITAINSNGENLEQMLGRSLLVDTEASDIHIFVSDQPFQLTWLNNALCRIKKEKISYIWEE